MKLIVCFLCVCECRSCSFVPDLIPTLLSLSTIRLPFKILDVSLQQVCAYVSKFRTRLSTINMNHLKRLVVFLDALKKFMVQWKEAKCAAEKTEKVEVITVAGLLEQLGRKAAGINLLEVERYLKESKVGIDYTFMLQVLDVCLLRQIARKISGYADKQAARNAGWVFFRLVSQLELRQKKEKTEIQVGKGQIPPLHVVEDLMVALTHTDGGIVSIFPLYVNVSLMIDF